MITYKPFFKYLLEHDITEYNLIYKQGISANTIQRMKNNKPITTTTLDTLCFILKCGINDVIEYTPDK